MKKIWLTILLFGLFLSGNAQTDVKGSKDHPVVSRFAGSWIRFYEFKDFDQYKL